MRGKDLAGLAALGTLGYMLANRKKDADVDTSRVSDVDLTGGARSMTQDTGELRAEDGTMSKLRRNTETGDLYSPNEPITRPSASSMESVQKAVRTPKMASQQFPMTKAPEYTPPEAKPKTNSRVGKAGQASGSSNEPSFQDKMAMEYLQKKRDREAGKDTGFFGGSQRSRPYLKDNMKAGGKVVKMAKGGMTASSRADGIAQRGKTRGTMVMCGGGYMKGKK